MKKKMRCFKNRKVIKVQVDEDSDTKLLLTFKNYKKKVFDISPYLCGKAFQQLEQKENFRKCKIDDLGGIEWEEFGISLSADTLYLKSSVVKDKIDDIK